MKKSIGHWHYSANQIIVIMDLSTNSKFIYLIIFKEIYLISLWKTKTYIILAATYISECLFE